MQLEKNNKSFSICNNQSLIFHDDKNLNKEFYTFPFRGTALPTKNISYAYCMCRLDISLFLRRKVIHWVKTWAVLQAQVKKTNRTRTAVEEKDKGNRPLQSTVVRALMEAGRRNGSAQGRPLNQTRVSTASVLAGDTCCFSLDTATLHRSNLVLDWYSQYQFPFISTGL